MKSVSGKKSIIGLLALFITITPLSVGCENSEPGAAGSVNLGIAYGSYTTARFKFIDLILPRAHASVSDLKMCFKRLRFKLSDVDTVDPLQDEDNVDFSLGLATIDGPGTYLGDVVVPAGNYKRVEFDLESDCVGGYSLQVTNGNGTWSSTDRITIKFSGDFTVSEAGTVTLDVQPILDALNSYSGTGTLKDTAEGASGVL